MEFDSLTPIFNVLLSEGATDYQLYLSLVEGQNNILKSLRHSFSTNLGCF